MSYDITFMKRKDLNVDNVYVALEAEVDSSSEYFIAPTERTDLAQAIESLDLKFEKFESGSSIEYSSESYQVMIFDRQVALAIPYWDENESDGLIQKTILYLALFAYSLTAEAQENTIISYDFADAIPPNWTLVDSTNNSFECIHTYTGIDALYTPASASELNSTTSNNGWLMFHATFYNTDSTDTSSEASPLVTMNGLITSDQIISFANEPQVFVLLEHYYRTLSNAQPNLLTLEVSNNNVTWTKFDLHTGEDSPQNVENGREIISLDISAVAANQPTVWVRFHFNDLPWHFWCSNDLIFSREDILTGVSQLTKRLSPITITPNPATNQISLENGNGRH